MGQKSTDMDSIMEVFYEFPNQRFTVRKLALKTKMPRSTVHKYLSELKKEMLITKENQPSDSGIFKIKKTFFYMQKLFKTGLIEYIDNELNPSCIILFGSFRKGDSVEDSDIDLFVETTAKKKISLTNFEKKLGHKIQLFIEGDINKLPDRLFNNVVNGIKLKGFFKIK